MTNSIRKLFIGSLLLWWLPLAAQGAESFQEGVQYRRLATPIRSSAPGKIEVIEFFWYGCPHCHRLEPEVHAWLEHKPENVEFVRIPAVLGRAWEAGARAYYAAEGLGVLDTIHTPLFDAMHAKENPIRTEEQLVQFFLDQGVTKEDFLKAYNSFDVETKLRRSQQLVRRYGITGVPSLVVNGKYETDITMAGSEGKVFAVVDYLIRKEQDQG